MDFIKNTFKVLESQEQMNELIRRSDKKKKIFFRYLLSPLRILGNKKVEKIEFQPNILQVSINIRKICIYQFIYIR